METEGDHRERSSIAFVGDEFMSTTHLIDVFSSLTAPQQAEIVARMKEMSRPDAVTPSFPIELLDRINERRELIRGEKGELPDSTDFLRRCRDGDEY